MDAHTHRHSGYLSVCACVHVIGQTIVTSQHDITNETTVSDVQ